MREDATRHERSRGILRWALHRADARPSGGARRSLGRERVVRRRAGPVIPHRARLLPGGGLRQTRQPLKRGMRDRPRMDFQEPALLSPSAPSRRIPSSIRLFYRPTFSRRRAWGCRPRLRIRVAVRSPLHPTSFLRNARPEPGWFKSWPITPCGSRGQEDLGLASDRKVPQTGPWGSCRIRIRTRTTDPESIVPASPISAQRRTHPLCAPSDCSGSCPAFIDLSWTTPT
jgi:hypothetical protein